MLRAIIFDCDGVLVDTEPLHLRMFQRVFAEEGLALTEAEYEERYLAMDDRGCFTAVLTDRGACVTEERVHDLIRRKSVYFEETMRESAPTFPGVVEFVRAAAKECPLAIASGALRQEVVFAVESLGARDCFQVIVAAEDVVNGKPDPEAYLTAMARLNEQVSFPTPLAAAECLVVEDSFHGVEAAKRAGMFCLAVTNSYPAEKLGHADWAVARLDELQLGQAKEAMK